MHDFPGLDTSLCMTPLVPEESCTVRYPNKDLGIDYALYYKDENACYIPYYFIYCGNCFNCNCTRTEGKADIIQTDIHS